MADISPFRGLRYREDIALDDVVAPPYDVLSAAAGRGAPRAQPVQRGPRGPAGAARRGGRRRGLRPRRAHLPRLARRTGRWCATSCRASSSSTRRTRGPDGRERTRRGFIARLRLADPGPAHRAAARAHPRGPQGRPPARCTGPPARTSARSSCCSRTTTAPSARNSRRPRPASPPPHGASRATATATGTWRRRSPDRPRSASPRLFAAARSTSPTGTTATRRRWPTATNAGRWATSAPTPSWSTCAASAIPGSPCSPRTGWCATSSRSRAPRSSSIWTRSSRSWASR